MTTLSITQPWAEAILGGYKLVENRKWATQIRGPFNIHAGRKFDAAAIPFIDKVLREYFGLSMAERSALFARARDRRGGLLGTAEIVDCKLPELAIPLVHPDQAPWCFGPHCFILANPRPIHKVIPWKGELGFFEVPIIAVAA